MYQVVGIRRVLAAYGVACGLVIAAWAAFDAPVDAADWWRIVSGSGFAVGLATWLLGQTAVFPHLCRLPIVRSYCPDIDGKWIAETSSNWAQIEARGKMDAGEPSETRALVAGEGKIRARLFFVRLDLRFKPRDQSYATHLEFYSISKSIAVWSRREEENGATRLYYVYENETNEPRAPTDSSRHLGAAYLDVIRDGKGTRLEGVYWTNRSWERALNTAGTIKLRRASSRTRS